MTLTHILLICLTVSIIVNAFVNWERTIPHKEYRKTVTEKFALYDNRITAHKHSVNKTIKEMDAKVEALKKSIKGIINFPQGEG